MQTITDIKRANAASTEPHWFDPGFMRFFRSRVLPTVFPTADGGALFVTSEQFDDAAPRRYTVRKCAPTGECSTVGDFQAYATAADAKRAARALI